MASFAGLLPVMVIWWVNEDFWWGRRCKGGAFIEVTKVLQDDKERH